MHEIEHINYHYYWQLTEGLDEIHKSGWEVLQIIRIEPSDDPKLMHRATILTRKTINNG